MSVSQPPCFGRQWDANAVECAGGLDAAYKDANGGHKREECGFFQQCGATKQATAVAATTTVVPAAQLTRFQRPVQQSQPVQTMQVTPQPAPMHQQQVQQQLTQYVLQQMQAMQRGTYTQQPTMVAPVQQPPVMGYQQMMPVNFQIPQYLTVREPLREDGTVWGMLGREVVRSVGKALGHTVSNFFDSITLG